MSPGETSKAFLAWGPHHKEGVWDQSDAYTATKIMQTQGA